MVIAISKAVESAALTCKSRTERESNISIREEICDHGYDHISSFSSSLLSSSSYTSSFFKESVIMVMNSTSTSSSQKWYQQSWLQISLLFLLCTVSNPTLASSSATKISYTDHCGSQVPESTPTDLDDSTVTLPQYQIGFYNGGDGILNPNSSYSSPAFSNSLWFRTQDVYKTNTEGVFKIMGSVSLQRSTGYYLARDATSSYSIASRTLDRSSWSYSLSLSLQGFWSESSRKLCMVGSAYTYSNEGKIMSLDLAAVLKLNYIKNSSILRRMVTGTLESLNSAQHSNHFEPISILMFPPTNYNSTLVPDEFDKGCSGGIDIPQNSSLSLSSNGRTGPCSILERRVNSFKLEYPSDCNSTKKCNPFGGDISFLPGAMLFKSIQCSNEKKRIQFLVEFLQGDYVDYYHSFNPNTTLVGEGSWDSKKNRLCVVACQILNVTNSLANAHVGDCSFRLSLRFPVTHSLRESSRIVGSIWTRKAVNDLGYFKRIAFGSSDGYKAPLRGSKYAYTEIDRAAKSCPKKKPPTNKGESYPNGYSSDMKFDMSVENSRGKIAWGYSFPLFVGNQIYNQHVDAVPLPNWSSASIFVGESTGHDSGVPANDTHGKAMNISYRFGLTLLYDIKSGGRYSPFNTSSSSNYGVEISAEGIYDPETGSLCMVGCRNLGLNTQLSTNVSMDCEIFVNIQFPPVNAKKGDLIKGRIESTRKESDPLYFERMDFSSDAYYTEEMKRFIWRMDFEIIMVLISKTLVCIFVGLQLFYVKKHRDVLPSISLVMLVILTLGHMIPLVLNFEALFLRKDTQQNFSLESDAWLEVNEVIVRLFTMAAFLMQLRLLQLSWSARLGNGNQKDSWVAEKKALFVSLPFYAAGGLMALFVHWIRHSSSNIDQQQYSILGALKSYAGLVLDGFLLPQILLNIFGNFRETALSHSFYFGTTFVRLLPHAYDLYRAHNFARHSNGAYVNETGYVDSYIYANHGADFYSTAWDVIISCGCLVFAVIIFLQQRFGGRYIVPQRFRETEVYEKVPVVSSD